MQRKIAVELLDLPPEIRHTIYDYSLDGIQEVEYFVVCSTPTLDPVRKKRHKPRYNRKGHLTVSAGGKRTALLMVNRQVRKETFDLILARATFRMACHHPYVVLPDSVRPNIELALCKYLDGPCRRDVYTFTRLRQLTCHINLNDGRLGKYGLALTPGPDVEVEMRDVVLYGLNPGHPWTLADAGYGAVMKICLDKERWFKVLIVAVCCWWTRGPNSGFMRRLVTVDVDARQIQNTI